MASLHDQKYKKWDKIAKEEIAATEEEERLEKEASDLALGKTTAILSESHKKEVEKAAQAKLAKQALDKMKDLEESMKYFLEGPIPNPTTILTPLILDAKFLDNMKIVTIKNCDNCLGNSEENN